MDKQLLSVGLDIGTTSTQMVVSQLTVENKAGNFSVPQMQITQRQILYKSPIRLTPLSQGELVDGAEIRAWVAQEYARAGISRRDVDTGAIIITGETSRKENAETVLHNLAGFAGDFVVATAGPDLESVLAAKGAGAVEYSKQVDRPVLHMDIGGGTSNLALIRDGQILATGCLNVGGRLVKLQSDGRLCYISPVLLGLFDGIIGQVPTKEQLAALAETLVSALEMAAGLRPRTSLLDALWTKEAGTAWCADGDCILSFSGGVADCIETRHPALAFGDIGPILGDAIRASRLCAGAYRLGSETIRATVIGAGCHSTQLSGSTVFHRNITFPLKNLPVITDLAALAQLDSPGILALDAQAIDYAQVSLLSDRILRDHPKGPVLIGMQADMAKALGHALALRLPPETPILCIDRVALTEQSYLDIAAPVGTALPVVIKTLIWNR